MAITSIWNNKFYYEGPQPKWLFEVDFTCFTTDETIKDTLSQAITNCKWGKREMSVVKTYFAGIEANFPGRVANANEMEIKFNENIELAVSKTLEKLFNDSGCNQKYYSAGGDASSYYNKFKKDECNIILKIIKPSLTKIAINNNDDTPSIILQFHNCWLKSINEEEFSYENTEEVLTRSAVFSYDYMTIEEK